MFKNIKERGFTDRLYFLNLTLSWLFIIICIVMTAFSGILGMTDLSLVSVGIPAVFAELGVHTGFIVWKAKTENIHKHGYDLDNGREVVAMGFHSEPVIEEEEEVNDNNVVHNDVDTRSRSNVTPNRSDKDSLQKFREALCSKSRRFN